VLGATAYDVLAAVISSVIVTVVALAVALSRTRERLTRVEEAVDWLKRKGRK
jgi:hypothetical protein